MPRSPLFCAALVALGLGAVPEARADLQQVGSWFVVDERQPDGSFSHCLLLNVYYRDTERVLLGLSLDPSRHALLSLSDPALTRARPKGERGSVAFNEGSPLTLRATGSGSLLRLDLPPWPDIGPRLRQAQTLRITARGSSAFFRLHDMPQALAALESCAATGKPPLSSQTPLGPR
ncbi:hypothetical protein [Pararhodospirillum photometricum]|nr:hypothetical protein [Pararhodospirillum photometricum]